MDLSQRIQAKTDNGDLIIDFLTEVMTDELDDFMMCHRLQAARLLIKYGCSCKSALSAGADLAQRDEGISFILDNPRELSRLNTDSNSSDDSEFDMALAKKIRESTDDGATVCRFLINVMEGQLKVFKPHHRIQAARELLSRGFGKHATSRRSGEETSPRTAIRGRNPEEGSDGGTHPSTPPTQPTESEKSPNHTNQSSDENEIPWDQINAIIDAAKEESDRILAEQEPDPENPPYERDLSSYDQAWENTQKWFEDWKNSLDPEEYEAIISKEAAEFDASLELRLKRRKQIAEDRERREKEEAEREAQQKEAEAEAETAAAEKSEPGPPTRSQHKPKLMFTLGNSMYIECGHPDCKLHDEDRNRWQGSVQYGAGPTSGHFP